MSRIAKRVAASFFDLVSVSKEKAPLLSLKDEEKKKKKGSSLFAKASHVCYQAVLRAAKEPLQTTTLLLLLEGVLHCEKRAPPARTMQSQEVVALSKEKEASIEL